MPPPDSFAGRIAWARAWRILNRPMFDAIYGPDPHARGPLPVATAPRRWRAANRARFDALFGPEVTR